MEWRGVTTTNVYVANFFFAAAFGLVVTAQWEMALGNGFAYTVFSAFGGCYPVAMRFYRKIIINHYKACFTPDMLLYLHLRSESPQHMATILCN
jgi:succinate-acetate transporter protein